jgi:hypothetical protein
MFYFWIYFQFLLDFLPVYLGFFIPPFSTALTCAFRHVLALDLLYRKLTISEGCVNASLNLHFIQNNLRHSSDQFCAVFITNHAPSCFAVSHVQKWVGIKQGYGWHGYGRHGYRYGYGGIKHG